MTNSSAGSDDDEGGVTSLRVGELVRQAARPESDPWTLALVQRDRVWQPHQVARLLDSLLVGYPIGSLLLCRLRDQAGPPVSGLGKDHLVETVDRSTWQLLDGQQRVAALATILTAIDPEDRYWLDLTADRPTEQEVALQRRRRVAATAYIRHRDLIAEQDGWADTVDRRDVCLDLSGFAGWVGMTDEPPYRRLQVLAGRPPLGGVDPTKAGGLLADALRRIREQETFPASDLGFLAEIDPECSIATAANLPVDHIRRAFERVVRLLALWFTTIPVEKRPLDSELDMLQAFERINLAGVPVARDDVFFAAIKTRWPASDGRLRAVSQEMRGLLSRRETLRFLARMASIAEGRGDMMPLRVERLNPPGGDSLRRGLVELTEPDGPSQARMEAVAGAVIRRSGLGHGLRLIPSPLFDAVLAWGIVRPEAPLSDEDISSMAAYLLGATALGHSSALRETFWSLALTESIAAGLAGLPFPAAVIAKRSHERFAGSGIRTRSGLRSTDSRDSRMEVVRAHPALFLSIAQRLPYTLPERTRAGERLAPSRTVEIEWDHIWPQDGIRRFRVGRAHQPGSNRINHPGNLWALDSPLNNYARAKLPTEKFRFLREPNAVEGQPDRWPNELDGFLTRDESRELEEIDSGLANGGDAANVVRAEALRFAELVDARTLRLYETLADDPRFGGWDAYARERAPLEYPDEPADLRNLGPGVAAALGLPVPPEPRHEPSVVGGDSYQVLLKRATEYGVLVELEAGLTAARSFGLYVSSWGGRWALLTRDRSGERRLALAYLVPEPSGVRLTPHFNNLLQLGVDSEAAASIFRADGNRTWPAGSAAEVSAIVERLAAAIRSS